METADYATILLSFITTFIVPLISQSKFSSKARQLIAMGLSITVGFISVAISEQWSVGNVVGSVMLSIVASQSFCQSLNKTGVLGAIEQTTGVKEDAKWP